MKKLDIRQTIHDLFDRGFSAEAVTQYIKDTMVEPVADIDDFIGRILQEVEDTTEGDDLADA